MSDTTIRIKNCNNITSGELSICANKLNILFGRNGTGKSTIARAISLASQGKQLTELAPYGVNNEDTSPQVDGVPIGNISIFDDDYVRQYVYQPDTLIKDTFEVLIRSKEYDIAKRNIDDALSKIKTTITGRQEIINLQSQIGVLIDTIKITSGNKIAKRGGAKGLLEGRGAYFNPPEELSELKPFFEENTVSKWAAWRLQGYEQFGNKGRCPYCSTGDSEKTVSMNKVFTDSFDKASVETAAAILKALEALKPYLSDEKIAELVSLFGVKEDLEVLETQLTKIRAEAYYLHEKLTVIVSFNGSSVDRDNIADLESKLKEMKVDFRAIDSYFVSELTKTEMNAVNAEIDSLLDKVGVLKGEIGKYNKYIQNKIKDRKQDINEFLNIAGFKYTFDVVVNGENDAKAILKFIMPDGNPGDVQSPGKHLSWGEKHAFALILFMFDAISRNAELVILDDPISSFDSNKKYAIINRLFKTRDKANSLYQRTVLMLTHDFEPVIDYIQVGSGRQDPSAVCAMYLENINGQLHCTSIRKNYDLMSSVVLLKELALDENIDIAARIGCLRKFIEHQNRNPREESEAYNILSSLIHGRSKPTYDTEGNDNLSDDEIANGIEVIKSYIPDFDYDYVLSQCTPQCLMERYSNEQSAYIKMLILRAYTEQDGEARERLRQTNDVLRKYVDETYHIENDYLYSLDVRCFNIVPEHYISDAEQFVANEIARFDFEESDYYTYEMVAVDKAVSNL
ncbi:AAA family ATPase [Anaerocolumna sedimenticola]|uniref:AAA family ATPase n=1 Tax=Anaerocolumna sedimenticola TaxID=2696063 RepID=A0A6P1TQ06_9FIRM|nr:AAA family ATPase [Anaerocolumna sedimenticola]QHQ61478.1 AAA family ATPase [Anaerocolumna sedimenticola]